MPFAGSSLQLRRKPGSTTVVDQVLIDNVILTAVSNTPEPGSLGLSLIGMAGLTMLCRRAQVIWLS